MAVTPAQLRASEERRSHLRQALLQRRSERQMAETSFAESVRLYVTASLESLRIQTEMADAVAREPSADLARHAPRILEGYRDWLADARAMLDDVQYVRQRGTPLPEAEEFRSAVRRIRVLLDNADRIQSAERHAAMGDTTPADEAFDELRRRTGA